MSKASCRAVPGVEKAVLLHISKFSWLGPWYWGQVIPPLYSTNGGLEMISRQPLSTSCVSGWHCVFKDKQTQICPRELTG